MSKLMALGVLCLSLFSCFTLDSRIVQGAESGFWDISPVNGALVFFGVAGDLIDLQGFSNRDEMIRKALEDAARRVAMFRYLEGSYDQYNFSGSGYLDWDYRVETQLTFDQDYAAYVEHLQFDPTGDIYIDGANKTLYVRTLYNPSAAFSVSYTRSSIEGKPAWVLSPPSEISGHAAGVGFAGPRGYYKDTVIVSYENAALQIVNNLSSTAHGENSSSSASSGGGHGSSEYWLAGAAALNNFYVLDFWVDPQTRAVWTLAVARQQ